MHFTPFLTLLSPRSALQLELECPRTSKRLSPSTQTALCQLVASWEDITGHHPSHTWAHRDGPILSSAVTETILQGLGLLRRLFLVCPEYPLPAPSPLTCPPQLLFVLMAREAVWCRRLKPKAKTATASLLFLFFLEVSGQ